jgi:hypothetical protein
MNTARNWQATVKFLGATETKVFMKNLTYREACKTARYLRKNCHYSNVERMPSDAATLAA